MFSLLDNFLMFDVEKVKPNVTTGTSAAGITNITKASWHLT